MLRPKKKITKRDIERDPFLDSVDKAQSHFEQNRSSYMKGALLVTSGLLAFNLISNRQGQLDVDSSASLGQALITLGTEDVTTAKFQLETVINDYENTPSASIAAYYLGKMNFDSGMKEESKTYLKKYIDDEPSGFLTASATIMLADVLSSEEKLDEALNLMDNAIRKCDSKKDLRMLKIRKAQIELNRGNDEAARILINDVLSDENITAWNKQVAQEIIGKIKS